MARATAKTLLPLDTWAKLMGQNPLHFNGARLPGVDPEPFAVAPASNPLWHQFAWQDNGSGMNLELLADVISQAEFDVASLLGYWPAPVWISQEIHSYPMHYRRELFDGGIDLRGQMKGIKVKTGRLIQGGRRATTLIATELESVGLIFSDPNGDGWNTLATVTAATTLTDECEIKLFFTGENGDAAWEIRPLKSVTISGGNVVITLDSWLLLDPDVVNAIPTNEVVAIDASNTPTNYVDSVEVRREFTDFITVPSAQFFWERDPINLLPFPTNCPSCSGTGCEACTPISQDGCFFVRDVYNGIGVPVPATYDTDDARWEKDKWTECREPDQVKVWYRAGEQSEDGLSGGCNKLDTNLARTIAILASARFMCNPGANNNLSDMMKFWQRDQSESLETSTIFTPPEILNNPLGTRRGEVEAYKSLFKLRERTMSVGALA